MKKIRKSKIQDGTKSFIHRELTWSDLLAPLKFAIYKFYYTKCKSRRHKDGALKEKKHKRDPSDEYAINSLSRSEVLFYKGLHIFEDDICVESILRSIHKLQAAVAAIIEDKKELTHNAKTLYYANQIIYRSSNNEKQMRFSTDFLEYLRFSVAKKITYNHEQGNGEFVIKARRTKIMGASIT